MNKCKDCGCEIAETETICGECACENDCENQAITKMPISCTVWPCTQKPNRAKLKKNEYGFMVCPLCERSFGEMINESDFTTSAVGDDDSVRQEND